MILAQKQGCNPAVLGAKVLDGGRNRLQIAV